MHRIELTIFVHDLRLSCYALQVAIHETGGVEDFHFRNVGAPKEPAQLLGLQLVGRLVHVFYSAER